MTMIPPYTWCYTAALLFRNVASTCYYSRSSLGIGTRQIRHRWEIFSPGDRSIQWISPKITGHCRRNRSSGTGGYGSTAPPVGLQRRSRVDGDVGGQFERLPTADYTGSASSYRVPPRVANCPVKKNGIFFSNMRKFFLGFNIL